MGINLISRMFVLFFLLLYGFKGDCKDLQSVVDYHIKNNKFNIVLEKNCIYTLKKPLVLLDNITINGNNSVLTQAKDWSKQNEVYEPLIKIVDNKNIIIKNLLINHAYFGYDFRNLPSSSVLIMGSLNCKLLNVKFSNLGKVYDKKEVKGMPFVLIVAQNQHNEFHYLPKSLKYNMSSVSGIKIDNCVFENINLFNSFAIRLLTNWTKKIRQENFKYKVKNCEITNSKFLGEYDWNTIELAGGGTTNNVIKNNYFSGKTLSCIDIDKGASYNTVSNNVIQDTGLPERHKNRKDVVHGSIMIHGSDGKYLSKHNKVLKNRIEKVSLPLIQNSRFTFSAGITAAYVEGLLIEENILTNLFHDSEYGAGIVLDQEVTDVVLSKNIIRKCIRGIVVTSNTRKVKSLKISDNQLEVIDYGLMLSSKKDANITDVILYNNVIKSKKNRKTVSSKNYKI